MGDLEFLPEKADPTWTVESATSHSAINGFVAAKVADIPLIDLGTGGNKRLGSCIRTRHSRYYMTRVDEP
jgi:hypothetical protein